MLKQRSLWCIAGLTLLLCSLQTAVNAACTPTSARICVEADDEASIYVDGILMGNFSYVNWDSSGTVPCMTITNAAILSALADGGRISTRTHNIGSGEMWLAYSIDVTCSGGQHAYVTSATTGGATGYQQNDCNNPPANPPGSGSANWYDPGFTPSGWSAPVVVTGQTWGKPVYHPGTGALLPMLSYSNTGAAGSSCEYYYMHQPFTLTAVTPPGPPALSITKSANPTTNIATGTRVTYTLNVCNTGGYTANPVTITDNFNSGFRYDGPNGGNTPTGPNFSASGATVTITWPNGIPGNACQAVSFWVVDDYQDPNTENCVVRGNTASVLYNNNSSNVTANSNNVNVTMLCIPTPTPTFTWTRTPTWTFTRTNTHTPTWTFTPTRSNTPTWTNTWTHTFTQTRTNTPTHTFTQTRTNTPTHTFTHTRSFTPTFTPTWTNTHTNTFSPTRTYTPTYTNTNTWTPVPVSTPTMTRTRTRTATATVTRSNTATPSSTLTATRTATRTITVTATQTAMSTATATPTATRTATPTSTRTATASATRSFSPSPTRTASLTATITTLDTRTHTPTATPSRTATRTSTPTPTRTATSSASPTFTASPTATITTLDTRTHTPTATPSRTVTLTATTTSTYTATPTATITTLDTRTHTPTGTPSRTATPTVTATSTYTVTLTVTVTTLDTSTHTRTITLTATPTATPTVTPSATITTLDTSTSTRTASNTVTASPSPTLTSTSTSSSTASPTATPTATPSSVASATHTPTATPSFTSSPTATPSATPTATRTHSGTLTATPTGTASYTSTRSATPSATGTPSFTSTRSATPSSTGTITLSATPSITPTSTPSRTALPIPMPYQLSIALYTSAGERVRLLYQGASATDASQVIVSGGLSSPLSLRFDGPLQDGTDTLLWRQDNDSGQKVDGGVYVLKIEATDSFGSVTAYNSTVQVIQAPPPATLTLYNAAGEAVRHYDAAALGLDPVDLGRLDGQQIELKERDGSINWLTLDGLNDHGRPLQGGSYQLVLHWTDGVGSHTIARSVAVVPAPMDDLLAGATLRQNPVPAGQPLQLRYAPCACVVRASLHDLAGQLITQVGDEGSGQISIPLNRAASGIYLLSLQAEAAGQRPSRRTLKVALLR